MCVNRLSCLLLLACCLIVPGGRAQEAPGVQSLAAVRRAAEQALRATLDAGLPGLRLEAAALDTRLRLPACRAALDGFATPLRPTQSRGTARVTCADPAWTVHVPVDVRRSQTVLVLRRAVGRGESLTAADVQAQTRDLPGISSPFLGSLDQLADRRTRRAIPEGAALTADALTPALLIHRGQTVTLVAQSAGFEIRAPGRAMADASARQRVRVQNLASLKIVEGLADKEGVVRVLP